ncbi:MAG: aromatic amino acid ammonia-lyase, partial [Acidobacteria bacterium]|nr:aromatic amino acid ammonia-lyase [Acidobacteriota bacterium]
AGPLPAPAVAGIEDVVLDGQRPISLAEFWRVSQGQAQFRPAPSLAPRLARCRELLDQLVAQRRLIYGVTTGFGPLATQHIDPSLTPALQRNLIYHLCSGVGTPYTPPETRGIMAARLISLSRGHSAIRPETFFFLLECLHRNLIPVVPSQGTVGASGDLTPLAHIALAFLGEGEIWEQGRPVSSGPLLARLGLAPLDLLAKEGLALVNGTSAMTAMAARNAVLARRALEWSARLSMLYAEVLQGKLEAFQPEISRLRPHRGQAWASHRLCELAQGSQRLAPVEDTRLELTPDGGVNGNQALLQDPYTIRCAPQILGAVKDVIDQHDRTVEVELNSVTDNPLFFPTGDGGIGPTRG